MKSLSLLPILLLCALGMLGHRSAHAAEPEAAGSAVAGLRLGLSLTSALTPALTPAHTSLPSELTIKVWLHNQSPSVRQIPLSLCSSIHWSAYGKLHVRVDGGRTYHLRMAAMIDTADEHPHGPLVLQPGERQEHLISLAEAAQFLPADDADMGLAEKLLSAQQIEVSAELGGGAKNVPGDTARDRDPRSGHWPPARLRQNAPRRGLLLGR